MCHLSQTRFDFTTQQNAELSSEKRAFKFSNSSGFATPTYCCIYLPTTVVCLLYIFVCMYFFSFDATILVNKDVYIHIQTYHKRMTSRIGRANALLFLLFIFHTVVQRGYYKVARIITLFCI